MKNLEIEWSRVSKIRVFEIPVEDNRTKEDEYIVFDISMYNDKFIAAHEALNQVQEESDFCSFVVIKLDPDFSLDENLQELHEKCIEAVMYSEFFNLK